VTSAGLPDRIAELEAIFSTGQMTADAVQAELLERDPSLSAIVDAWQSTSLKTLMLTSKGIALGYTYWQQLSRNPADLSIWLPD
jgi:hypothetical protein